MVLVIAAVVLVGLLLARRGSGAVVLVGGVSLLPLIVLMAALSGQSGWFGVLEVPLVIAGFVWLKMLSITAREKRLRRKAAAKAAKLAMAKGGAA